LRPRIIGEGSGRIGERQAAGSRKTAPRATADRERSKDEKNKRHRGQRRARWDAARANMKPQDIVDVRNATSGEGSRRTEATRLAMEL
jgi:hypothetical protein